MIKKKGDRQKGLLMENFILGYVSRTRVSAVEVWRNDSTDGEVQVAHGINSWPALLGQLNGKILYGYSNFVK